MQYGSYTDDFEDSSEGSVDRDDDDGDGEDGDGEEASSRGMMPSHAMTLPRGGGQGRARDDVDDSALMAMSRRDGSSVREAKSLKHRSVEEMRRFLRERESGMTDPMQSVPGVAVMGLEVLAGALAGGYLSQRFRDAGAIVPVGVTLGALGLAAAQFGMVGKFSPDLRMVSFGALASAVALWAAGRGIITAEAVAHPGVTGTNYSSPQAAQQATPQPTTAFTPIPQQQQQQQQQPQPFVVQQPFGAPVQQPFGAPARPPFLQPVQQPAFPATAGFAHSGVTGTNYSSPRIAAPPASRNAMSDFQNLVAPGRAPGDPWGRAA